MKRNKLAVCHCKSRVTLYSPTSLHVFTIIPSVQLLRVLIGAKPLELQSKAKLKYKNNTNEM